MNRANLLVVNTITDEKAYSLNYRIRLTPLSKIGRLSVQEIKRKEGYLLSSE
ncbi:hypothetical protein yberc0001_27350 [Yersinia bercovieri ATCC 43970]|uniref:Uncharacterized protein n=1 Tax=Yersinia bercovieri ATCC 43970 TaxID=349968 RepID=A0ABM9XZL6_YERBE|nr:hypothetical protein yberc0001_27350 [Yersinia bercovieri ATCC 43970]